MKDRTESEFQRARHQKKSIIFDWDSSFTMNCEWKSIRAMALQLRIVGCSRALSFEFHSCAWQLLPLFQCMISQRMITRIFYLSIHLCIHPSFFIVQHQIIIPIPFSIHHHHYPTYSLIFTTQPFWSTCVSGCVRVYFSYTKWWINRSFCSCLFSSFNFNHVTKLLIVKCFLLSGFPCIKLCNIYMQIFMIKAGEEKKMEKESERKKVTTV